MTLGEDGEICKADAVRAVDQALEGANRLYDAIKQRKVHEDIRRFRTEETIQQNYFHAVSRP